MSLKGRDEGEQEAAWGGGGESMSLTMGLLALQDWSTKVKFTVEPRRLLSWVWIG